MKKQKTMYHLIVDKSGSMGNCTEQTINGYNEQVNRVKSLEQEFRDQQITIGLTTFNTRIDHDLFCQSPEMAMPMTRETYRPDGGTALLDAIGTTVEKLEKEMQLSDELLPTTAVVVIITDGYENASRLYTLADVKAKIARLESTGKWTFSFIGNTLDAVDVAEQMAIKKQNSYRFDKQEMKTEVWDKLSESMGDYLQKKTAGRDLGNLFEK